MVIRHLEHDFKRHWVSQLDFVLEMDFKDFTLIDDGTPIDALAVQMHFDGVAARGRKAQFRRAELYPVRIACFSILRNNRCKD